jgi:hypothetical protein
VTEPKLNHWNFGSLHWHGCQWVTPVGLFSFLAGDRKTWSRRNTQRATCGEPVIQALGVPF